MKNNKQTIVDCQRCEKKYPMKELTWYEDAKGNVLLALCPICEPGRHEEFLHEERTNQGTYTVYIREREDSVDDDYFLYLDDGEGYSHLVAVESTYEDASTYWKEQTTSQSA